MSIYFQRFSLGAVAAAISLAFVGTGVHAGGFQLNETSASGLGNAFAGGAAAAEDASTLWPNVAGLARVRDSGVVGALHLVTPSLKFRNGASQAALGQALGGDGGDAGGLAAVPNLYLARKLDSTWTLGLGLNSPWGLVTEYDDGWAGRFQAIKSSIKTMNVNPGVSVKVSDRMALGLGLNAQHIAAEFTNQVNYAGALLGAAALNGIAPGTPAFNAIAAATAGLESRARIKGSDLGTGWNIGALWEPDDKSRFGAQYRSGVSYRIDGNATFANPAVPAAPPVVGVLANGVNTAVLFDTRITSRVKMPAIVNLSYFATVNDQWDVMADAQWTEWSVIRNLTFVRADGTELQSTPENFKNTWKLAFGANYRYSPQWMLRGGVAFDQSPVQTAFRTARLPDAGRTWLALGAQYTVNPKVKIDVGGSYLFVKKATINANGDPTDPTAALANGLVNGRYDNRTVILSAQVNYTF
jgi:long-chain fatty acid transport protein